MDPNVPALTLYVELLSGNGGRVGGGLGFRVTIDLSLNPGPQPAGQIHVLCPLTMDTTFDFRLTTILEQKPRFRGEDFLLEKEGLGV